MPDTEKTPGKTPANDLIEDFFKSSQETLDNAINNVLDKRSPPPNVDAFRHKLILWLFRSLIAVLAASVVPLGTAAFTYGKERARIDMEIKQKESESILRQRKLQLQLLKQVIDVAKKADFTHPSSVYQLGLIAHMVNENWRVFGIRLKQAEETMKQMFQRLSPITGLRRRMAESDVLVSSMEESLELIHKNEQIATKRISNLKKKLMKLWKLPAWKKRKFEAELQEKQYDLTVYRTKEEFYATRLERERTLRKYFHEELAKQANSLKKLLEDVVKLRNRLFDRLYMFKYLVKVVIQESDAALLLAPKLERATDRIDGDFAELWNMVRRLSRELQSLAKQKESLSNQLKLCMSQCSQDSAGTGNEYMPDTEDKTESNKADTVSPSKRRAPTRKLQPKSNLHRLLAE